jgi:hypothetical protein
MVLRIPRIWPLTPDSIRRSHSTEGRMAARAPDRPRSLLKSASMGLARAPSDLFAVGLRPVRRRVWAGSRTSKALAVVAAIAGSLMTSSTAPALLEGARDGAVDVHGAVNPGADGYARLSIGDRYAHVFASAGAASSLSVEADPLAGGPLCDPSSGIDTSMTSTADSARKLSAGREGLCFGPHGAIEYYESFGNAERRSAGAEDVNVPWAVRSQLVDSRLFEGRLSASRESPARRSRPTHVSAPAKVSRTFASRAPETSAWRPTGCSRCPGQVVRSSPRRAKSLALVFPWDVLRNARSVRRERLPSGVARQREAPQMTAWSIRRGWWSASLRRSKDENS